MSSNLVDPAGAPINPDMSTEDILQFIATRMPAPNQEDFKRGGAMYASALSSGITREAAMNDSIWATFLGMMGAIERLQRKAFPPKLPNMDNRSRLKSKRPAAGSQAGAIISRAARTS